MRLLLDLVAKIFIAAALIVLLFCLGFVVRLFFFLTICFDGIIQPSNRDFLISAYQHVYPHVDADDIDFEYTNPRTVATSATGGKIEFWYGVTCRFNIFSNNCWSRGPHIEALKDGVLCLIAFDKCGRVREMSY